jgi:hypothetical protein
MRAEQWVNYYIWVQAINEKHFTNQMWMLANRELKKAVQALKLSDW